MDLDIKISNVMDIEVKQNSFYEHRTIRIPAEARDRYNLCVGDFLHLRDKWGKLTTLQISEAFKEDVQLNNTCGYVTTQNYNKLFIKYKNCGEVQKVKNITLGCDPEAFLVDITSGNIIAAYRLMKKHGDVGHDGLLLEFRPMPSTNENEVILNLLNLIYKARTMLNERTEGQDITILAASSYKGLSAGFHLHYGLPSGLLGKRSGLSQVAKLMTTAFDYYIGVPSIIPEGNTDYTRRTLQFVEYGKPGGYRLDNRTFEYRLPGGINLRHPCLARGLIALGAVVVEDLVSRINTSTGFFSNLNEIATVEDLLTLYPRLPNVETLYSIICNPSIEQAKLHFKKIKEDVRKMIGYKNRASSIESYFNCLDQNIQYNPNLEINWRTFNEEQQAQMVVL